MKFKDMFDGIYTSIEDGQFWINYIGISATISIPDKYKKLFEAASKIEYEDERDKEYSRIEMLAEEDDEVWDLLAEASNAVENKSGTWLVYDNVVYMMDDDLREELHIKLSPCTAQEFFTAYEEAHEERFGEMWELSKKNPMY